MEFSEKVKNARKQLNLSQERFAAKLGMSFASINRWEKGHSKPSYLAQTHFENFCKDNGIVFDDNNK